MALAIAIGDLQEVHAGWYWFSKYSHLCCIGEVFMCFFANLEIGS